MRQNVTFALVAIFVLLLMAVFPLSDLAPQRAAQTPQDLSTEQSIMEAYGGLPLLFIENRGQVDEAVSYYVKTSGQTLYFTSEGMVFDLIRYNKAEAESIAARQAERLSFSLDFVGANRQPVIEGISQSSTRVNYFIGNNPQKWHTSIPTYTEVVYHDIYPNIDLRLYGEGGRLRYDFIVQPGASPDAISLAYRGIDSLKISNGELVVSTKFGDTKQSQPYIYQRIGGEVVEVDGGFRLADDSSYGFYVAAYDTGYPLIIDPVLVYSTYLGGWDFDEGDGIAVDASGCAYVVGYTTSDDFPITPGAYQEDYESGGYAFVTKFNEDGSALVYSTYLGGTNWQWGHGIAVDASGCAYVTGFTYSSDFPTLGAYQDFYVNQGDVFVTKLNAAGSALVYSTYLGGSSAEEGNGIAVDASGCAYVTGHNYNGGFPTTAGAFQPSPLGQVDAVVIKIDTTKSGDDSLIYSTYLGGEDYDGGYGIAVDASGCAYVTGYTSCSDFPTTDGAYQEDYAGNTDAFVTKFNEDGSALVYSTYLGGSSSWEYGHGIAVDASGCAYVTGFTYSDDFPTTPDAFQEDLAGEFDVFFTKFNEDGSALAYSTYFGGSGEEGEGNYCGIAADASGCAYVTSGTFSEDFPTTEGAFQGDYADNGDAFVFKFCKIAPTVATSAATDVTADSATLNMSYTLGEYSAVEVRFAYKKSADSTWSYTSWVTDPGSPYSELISGLDSDTQYDFKAQLRYDSTVIEGDVLQFTTGSAAQTPLLPPPGPRVSPSLTPPSLPATNVRLLNVGVSPGQAQAGQPVTVTANIVNEGASAGSYNAALRINGRVEQQRVVEVSPGTAYPVKFTVAKSQPGKYEVAVENQRASFVVLAANSASKAPASSGLIALVIIGLLVLATAVVLVMAFRKFA